MWMVRCGTGLALLCCAASGCKRADDVNCSEVAQSIQASVDALSTKHGACEVDEDCTYAVVTLPCDSQTPRAAAVARARFDAFRAEAEELAKTLCSGPRKICNPYCGAKGSGHVDAFRLKCRKGDCDVDFVAGGGSVRVPSAELCDPKAAVWVK